MLQKIREEIVGKHDKKQDAEEKGEEFEEEVLTDSNDDDDVEDYDVHDNDVDDKDDYVDDDDDDDDDDVNDGDVDGGVDDEVDEDVDALVADPARDRPGWRAIEVDEPIAGRNDARAQATEMLRRVGLADRLAHYPKVLSGGEQQRVVIARALVNEPLILIADEPTGNLDSRSSFDIADLFVQLNNQGKTIVMITHEPDIAQFAKRMIFLRDGRILTDKVIEKRKTK